MTEGKQTSMENNAPTRRLGALDAELAARSGAYLSYSTEHDPVSEEFFGPNPVQAIDEILASYATAESCVLDLGCGAGFSLCLLAAKAREVWGFDEEAKHIEATRLRAERHGLKNVQLIHGAVGDDSAVARLPDDALDFGFSRRGPNMLRSLLPKLKPNAIWIQEHPQWPTGVNEIMGQDKRFFFPHARGDAGAVVDYYAHLGFAAVSVHTWFYEQYFRDVDHLGNYLNSAWFLIHRKYDPTRDRDALDVYARYNTTDKGIRLTRSRILGVFRRCGEWPLPADNFRSPAIEPDERKPRQDRIDTAAPGSEKHAWERIALDVEYREMRPSELSRIGEVNREEWIEGRFVVKNDDSGVGLRAEFVRVDPPKLNPAWDARGVAQRLANWRPHLEGGGALYGAFQDKRLVGFVLLGPKQRDGSAEIVALFVDKDWRRRGIGSTLISLAEERAGRMGAVSLFLYSNPTGSSVGTYLSLGFEIVGLISKEIVKGLPGDIVMAKKMTDARMLSGPAA